MAERFSDAAPVSRHFLLGGGGFSSQLDPTLDERVLQLGGKPDPAICFLPTASGDADAYIQKFQSRFAGLPCRPTVLSLFRPTQPDIHALLLSMDVIYVGGGNTKNMLAVWRAWNLAETLRRAAAQGCVLAGVSAGLICWFDEGITDSEPFRLGPLPGLGDLRGLACPHFDSEAGREATTQAVFAATNHRVGYGVQDGVALEFEAGRLVEAVTTRPGAGYMEYARDTAGAWRSDFRPARQL